MDCFFMWQQGCAYDSSATAAWMQAVFSVLAIVAAGLLPMFDRRRRRNQYRAALSTLARAAYSATAKAWHLMADPEMAVYSLALVPSQMRQLREAIDDLRAFPVVEVEAPGLIGPLRTLADHLHVAHELLAEARDGRFPPNGVLRLELISDGVIPVLRRILIEMKLDFADVPAGEAAEPGPLHRPAN